MAGAVNSRLLLRLMQVDSGEVVTHPARITLWLVNFDCFGQKKKKKPEDVWDDSSFNLSLMTLRIEYNMHSFYSVFSI